MIGQLRGQIIACAGDKVVLDVNGVGFQLFVPSCLIADLANGRTEVVLHTHLHVRENELALYGFSDVGQRDMFESLLEVNGVGPRVALAALSAFTPEALSLAISVDDIALLSSIAGIGTKTAQRIALDLKGKVTSELDDGTVMGAVDRTPARNDAHAALDAMGFSSAEITVALRGVDMTQETPFIIKDALHRLGGVRA